MQRIPFDEFAGEALILHMISKAGAIHAQLVPVKGPRGLGMRECLEGLQGLQWGMVNRVCRSSIAEARRPRKIIKL